MPASSAERQRKRREKLKASGSYENYKLKNSQYSQKSRAKKKNMVSKLGKSDQDVYIEQKREKDRKRQQNYRSKKRQLNFRTPQMGNNGDSPVTYSSRRSFSRASNKVESALPPSPRKKRAVIKRLARQFQVSLTYPVKQSRITRLGSDTIDAVKAFYKRDDVSRISPGIRDVVTVRNESGKLKEQKRHLSMSIKETYARFKDENPNIKIGLSKFSELRPQEVKLSSETPWNVCQCTYHQNFILAIEALHKYLPAVPQYSTAFPATCLKSPDDEKCWFGECTHSSCGFSSAYPLPSDPKIRNRPAHWKKWQEKNGRLIKDEVSGSLLELYNYVSDISVKFLEHCFVKRKQAASYEADKKMASLPNSECAVLQIDFAENYTCSSQNEVQSAHWNQAQVTLFTSVIWSRNNNIKSHVIVSDYMSHDKNAVVVFLDQLLSTVDNEIKLIKIWSDGPASQFKNRYVMSTLPSLAKKHSVELEWNFSATSHGKGPVDGVGATLKRKASDLVKTGQETIYSAEEFNAAVGGSTIATSLITANDVQQRMKSLQLPEIFDAAPAYPGISAIHFVSHKNGEIVMKRYSSKGIVGDTEMSKTEGLEVLEVPKYNVNDIVAVSLIGKNASSIYVYLAQVLQIDEEEVFLRYMVKTGNHYKWPVNADESWQPSGDILCKMQQPNLVNNRGQLQFKEEEIKRAKELALKKIGVETALFK